MLVFAVSQPHMVYTCNYSPLQTSTKVNTTQGVYRVYILDHHEHHDERSSWKIFTSHWVTSVHMITYLISSPDVLMQVEEKLF